MRHFLSLAIFPSCRMAGRRSLSITFFVPSVVLLAFSLVGGTSLTATTSGVEWPVSSGGNGHRYQYFAGPATWNQAAAAAEEAGGYLATATSAAENAFMGVSP